MAEVLLSRRELRERRARLQHPVPDSGAGGWARPATSRASVTPTPAVTPTPPTDRIEPDAARRTPGWVRGATPHDGRGRGASHASGAAPTVPTSPTVPPRRGTDDDRHLDPAVPADVVLADVVPADVVPVATAAPTAAPAPAPVPVPVPVPAPVPAPAPAPAPVPVPPAAGHPTEPAPSAAPTRRPRRVAAPTAADPVVPTPRGAVLEVLRDVVGLGSRGGRRSWTRGIQVLVAAAALLTLAVGLRAMFAPVSASSTPASATFPQAVAASTAERFAEAYFTWDAADPAARSEALSTLMVGGIPGRAGWDGTGTSTAGQARAAGFTYVDAADAIVTVVLPVTSAPDGRSPTTSTMSLQVPVMVVGSRVWVSGLPASVGVPASAPTPADSSFALDADASKRTRGAVAQYFAALGQGNVTLSDSGNTSTGLDGTLRYTELIDWRVERGGGDRRVGFATVRWTTASGASLDQDYRVEVSTDDAGWRVRAASAALPTP